MTIKDKFEKFINENTSDGFHDAMLNSIHIDIDEHVIKLKIMHWIDQKSHNKVEGYYITNILFYKINNLVIDDANCFGIEDEIDRFDIVKKNGDYKFELVGIHGWVLSFSSIDFKFEELYHGIDL